MDSPTCLSVMRRPGETTGTGDGRIFAPSATPSASDLDDQDCNQNFQLSKTNNNNNNNNNNNTTTNKTGEPAKSQVKSHRSNRLEGIVSAFMLKVKEVEDEDEHEDENQHDEREVVQEDEDEDDGCGDEIRAESGGHPPTCLLRPFETSPSSQTSSISSSSEIALSSNDSGIGLAQMTMQTNAHGCKKRKLYQPVQTTVPPASSSAKEVGEADELATDDDHVASTAAAAANDTDSEHSLDSEREDKGGSFGGPHGLSISVQSLISSTSSSSVPSLSPPTKSLAQSTSTMIPMMPSKSSSACQFNDNLIGVLNMTLPQPPPPPPNMDSSLQAQYYSMARQLMRDQQDRLAKEVIARELMNASIEANTAIAERLVAVSPQFASLADTLRTEVSASLVILIDNVVGRFLENKRLACQTAIEEGCRQTPEKHQRVLVDDFCTPSSLLSQSPNLSTATASAAAATASTTALNLHESTTPTTAATTSHQLKQSSSKRTLAGIGAYSRAPQVRDRAAPRQTAMPLSMANPKFHNSLSTTTTATSTLNHGVFGNSLANTTCNVVNTVSSSRRKDVVTASNVSSHITSDQIEALSLVLTPTLASNDNNSPLLPSPAQLSRGAGDEKRARLDGSPSPIGSLLENQSLAPTTTENINSGQKLAAILAATVAAASKQSSSREGGLSLGRDCGSSNGNGSPLGDDEANSTNSLTPPPQSAAAAGVAAVSAVASVQQSLHLGQQMVNPSVLVSHLQMIQQQLRNAAALSPSRTTSVNLQAESAKPSPLLSPPSTDDEPVCGAYPAMTNAAADCKLQALDQQAKTYKSLFNTLVSSSLAQAQAHQVVQKQGGCADGGTGSGSHFAPQPASDADSDLDGSLPCDSTPVSSLACHQFPLAAYNNYHPHQQQSTPHGEASSPSSMFGNLVSGGASHSPVGGNLGTSTLSPMHLRKAKLLFFWVRYPSSSVIKMNFPDIKFNKNNTAQLVKWFSNFREFFYIQMEKYGRHALAEGLTRPEDIVVTPDSELFRVISMHYNRNNHIEVPSHFLPVVQSTLREFFIALSVGKDTEASWKKQIYKVIARLDEPIPDYFRSDEFLRQLE